MSSLIRHNRPVSSGLHPLIYAALVALAALFVAAAWGFDLNGGEAAYLIAVVSGFFLMAVLLPAFLARVALRHRDEKAAHQPEVTLRDWMEGDFQTWQSRLKGSEAAIMIVLPFAAAAIGMVAIAIVLHVVVASGAA